MFLLYYQPKQHLSIDEMMIGAHCRISPKETDSVGHKGLGLSEAKTDYVLGFKVYIGSESDNEKKAMQEGLFWIYYMDNFYTSLELLLDLLKIDVHTSNVRINRKHFPKELVPPDKSMGMDSYIFATSEKFPLMAAWWKDRRDIFVLSSIHKKATEMVLKQPKRLKGEDEHTMPINDRGL